MEEILKELLLEMKEARKDIRELREDVKELKIGQERLQKNIIDSLGAYTENIVDYAEDRTEALNKRVFRVESVIERIKRTPA